MKKFKLNIDLLPKGAWDNDFSKTLSKKDWDNIRNHCYKKAKNKCQICGHETEDLDTHEVWDFNTEKETQTLLDIIGICTKCHGVIHIRNSTRLGYGQKAKAHFIKVNKCTEMDFASHFAEALIKFEERNKVLRWKMISNLSKFGGDDIEIKEKFIPIISCYYSNKDLDFEKKQTTLAPRILDIMVDNYKGLITIICDKVNSITWYGENNEIIAKKFNFGEVFRTSFCVKDLLIKSIYFELNGQQGKTISKKFNLSKYK